MSQVEAIYQNGVFMPLNDVGLSENQRVRLNFEALESNDAGVWLAEVQARQRRIVAERGYFPDSSNDIAEDRRR